METRTSPNSQWEPRGSDTPTLAEAGDPGAHDRGGWLTLEEAARRYDLPLERLEQALQAGDMAGRRLAGEAISPQDAAADAVVPEAVGPQPMVRRPADDWLVQPDQVEAFLERANRAV